MLEKCLELSDIMLIPAELNNGVGSQCNYGIQDAYDGTDSLPIFTTPLDSVVSGNNWKMYQSKGIRPVLPITIDLGYRLNMCQQIFSAFTFAEIKENFLSRGKRVSSSQFRICIDNANGHDTEIFNLIVQLRQVYSNQVIIMSSPIGNPKTYLDYCRAGADYVRVGIGSGSLVDNVKYCFYHPTASLLIDIAGIKSTTAVGLRHPKVIVDGGVYCASDILKCLALGADYVMMGRTFAKTLECAGTLYQKTGIDGITEISRKEAEEQIKELGSKEARVFVLYSGQTTYDYTGITVSQQHDGLLSCKNAKTEWIRVVGSIDGWLKEMYEVFSYGFTLAGASGWKEFKDNIRYVRIS